MMERSGLGLFDCVLSLVVVDGGSEDTLGGAAVVMAEVLSGWWLWRLTWSSR